MELLENNHADEKKSHGITTLGLIYCIFNFCWYCRARGNRLHASQTPSSTKRVPSPSSATPMGLQPFGARWVCDKLQELQLSQVWGPGAEGLGPSPFSHRSPEPCPYLLSTACRDGFKARSWPVTGHPALLSGTQEAEGKLKIQLCYWPGNYTKLSSK